MHALPKSKIRENLFHAVQVFFYLAAVALILIWPAVWNRFPLIFSDSGAYISSAFTFWVPVDRPLGYGLFIRFFSMGTSLWLLIYCQALLTAYLLWKTLGIFVTRRRYLFHFIITVLLAGFSSLPWMVSQVMPDILTGLIFLIITVFLFGEAGFWERCFLVCLMMFFLITHSANFLLSWGILLFACLAGLFMKNFVRLHQKYFQRIAILAAVTLFAPLFFLASNHHQGYGFVMNPSSYIFMMSRANESGILDDFLSKNCAQSQYYLCLYRGHFPRNDNFIWAPESPLNILGWEASRPEYNDILHQIFSSPQYLAEFTGDSLYRSVRQFLMLGLDNFFSYSADSSVYRAVNNHFPQELTVYSGSRQFAGELQSVDGFALTFMVAALLSLLMLGVLFFRRSLSAMERFFLYLVLVFLPGNALVMATLSGVYGRYQERIVWLLPLTALLFVLPRVCKKYFRKTPDDV
jgi:hypothetical protein